MITIYLATNNWHKVAEFNRLCPSGECSVRDANVLGGMPNVEETGTNFAENATLKARALFLQSDRHHPVLADDSGLCVDALDGAPGIRSARYGGNNATDTENRQKLLRELREIPFEKRSAHFHCALVLFLSDATAPVVAEGRCDGHIALAPAGTGGFGYDPIFIPSGYACTMAQLTPAQKDAISHRANALRTLLTDRRFPDGRNPHTSEVNPASKPSRPQP